MNIKWVSYPGQTLFCVPWPGGTLFFPNFLCIYWFYATEFKFSYRKPLKHRRFHIFVEMWRPSCLKKCTEMTKMAKKFHFYLIAFHPCIRIFEVFSKCDDNWYADEISISDPDKLRFAPGGILVKHSFWGYFAFLSSYLCIHRFYGAEFQFTHPNTWIPFVPF